MDHVSGLLNFMVFKKSLGEFGFVGCLEWGKKLVNEILESYVWLH